MADNPLTKLPLAGQAGVGLVAAAVIVGVFWFAFPGYDQMLQDETRKQGELTKLQDENRVLKAAAANEPALKEKVAKLAAQLEIIKSILPPAKETPELLKQVQYLATQSNLLIRKFTPGRTTKKEFFEVWPIAIDVEGNYHNLARFFEKVGRLRRLVNIGDIKIKTLTPQTLMKTIAVSCSATTYVYEDKPAAPGAGK